MVVGDTFGVVVQVALRTLGGRVEDTDESPGSLSVEDSVPKRIEMRLFDTEIPRPVNKEHPPPSMCRPQPAGLSLCLLRN